MLAMHHEKLNRAYTYSSNNERNQSISQKMFPWQKKKSLTYFLFYTQTNQCSSIIILIT